MIIEHTQVVSHMERAAMAYATPQLSLLGSIRDVTGGSGVAPPAGPKGGNSAEGNQGGGIGDLRREL